MFSIVTVIVCILLVLLLVTLLLMYYSNTTVGKINIVDPAGMKLAETLGVLDEGLPNVRLFSSKKKPAGVSIVVGTVLVLVLVLLCIFAIVFWFINIVDCMKLSLFLVCSKDCIVL